MKQLVGACGGGAHGREHAPEGGSVLRDAGRAHEHRAVADVGRAQHEAGHLVRVRVRVRVRARARARVGLGLGLGLELGLGLGLGLR